MKLAHATLLLMLFAGLAAANDAAAALAHYNTLPVEVRPFVRYLSMDTAADGVALMKQSVAFDFIVPSASRQTNLAASRPLRITQTLRCINLQQLGWSVDDWNHFVAHYPYRPAPPIRVDWFLEQVCDQTESDIYLRLLFGEVPQDMNRVFEILGVANEPQLTVGLIQSNSGVSVVGDRWIDNRPKLRGYAWGTRDVLELDGDSDPLEHIEGGFKHDGEEHIFGLPKFDPATGEWGALQAYVLANAQGKLVERAPVNLVRDHSEFRGFAEIRNPGSCFGCHDTGINPVGPNLVIESLKTEAEATTKDFATYDRVNAFHLSRLDRFVQRDNEDFAAGALLACGESSAEASLYVKETIETYDQPLTLERAAAEVYLTPVELRRALAYADDVGYRLGARLSVLAHGGKVPREAFEENYQAIRNLAEQWRLTQ